MLNYKLKTTAITFVLFFLYLGLGVAADYKTMTTEELSTIRGTLYDAPQAEREAFQKEWSNRMDQLTPSDRQKYHGQGGGKGLGLHTETRTPAKTGNSYGRGDGPGDGSGRGSKGGNGNGGGRGGGGGNGGGNGRR